MAAALVGGCGGAGDDGPPPPDVPEPPPEHRAAGFFGVSPQTDLTEEDYEEMASGGVSLIRLGLSWGDVQSHAGECDPKRADGACNWTAFDDIVGQAAARGIRILPALGGRAPFVEGEVEDEAVREHPPTSGEGLEAWRSFVRAVAARYGRGGAFWKEFEDFSGLEPLPVEEWQVWNEPNSASYWPPEPDPIEYATLVRETTTALRESDPEAEVVLGGMFGTATVPSRKFLREMYSVEGIEDYFDSVAIHPYSPDVEGVEVQAKWLMDTAREAGDEDVGLWVTELGWSTEEGSHPLELGAEAQADLLAESFDLLLREREAWNIEGVVVFTWKDAPDAGVCEFCEQAGMLDAAGNPKPAWEVFGSYSDEVTS